ncbi:MAG TPA: TMEM175 family protein [Acidimicrobiales bacterium]|nr:TMEM175 family protein [Acidimicrobiales bacterium]
MAGEVEREGQRLEAFSDGVMAVIITLMALDLRVPAGHQLTDLEHSVPSLLVYLLSFASIGIYWNNHHHLLRATDRISGAVMWSNLHLLFWLSLIPVFTDWLSHQYKYSLPAAMYGADALLCGVAYTILVRAIIRCNGTDSRVAEAIGSDVKGWASVALYALGICFAWVTPWLAFGFYAAVAVMWFVPDRRLDRREL